MGKESENHATRTGKSVAIPRLIRAGDGKGGAIYTMLDHINLLQHLMLMLGGMLGIWFLVMFVYFWVLERRRYRR